MILKCCTKKTARLRAQKTKKYVMQKYAKKRNEENINMFLTFYLHHF